MSTIEERLARDIAAVTGGVVVTESELKDARDEMQERVESRRRRNRRRTVAAVVAAAVVIPIVGIAIAQSVGKDETAPPVSPVSPSAEPGDQWLTGTAVTQRDIEGVWREDNGITSIRFSPSGDVAIDTKGRLFGDPAIVGTYEVAGDQVTVNVDGGSAGCDGDTFVMRASITKSGVMRYVPIEAGSGTCSLAADQWGAWEHVLPAASTFANFNFSDKEPWGAWSGPRSLHGMWAAEGGGYLLEIDRDGSYLVVDESGEPVDRGQWSYGDSELTLTSSAASVECAAGDKAVLVDLEQVNPGTLGMQYTVADNTCGGAWVDKEWFLVPNANSRS
jgi:hypothetical protein